MCDRLILCLQHSGRFDSASLEEEWVIVPVSLRITGYSPSPIPAYADRPTINVEGEMGGVGWDGNIDIADEDIRRVHGTVSVLADGSVRWSIVRPYVIALAPRRLTRAIDIPR